jgi:hypothetical protein
VDEHALANPFNDIEALVKEDISAKWARGVFAVNRDVYEEDDALCAALESAVWVSFICVAFTFLKLTVVSV